MILIKDVTIEKVDGDYCDVMYYKKRVFSQTEEELGFIRETINGRLFINERGEDVVLGMSKKVQDVLGLPMDIFEKQNNQIQSNGQLISKLRTDIKEIFQSYETMSFWQRLKFLFIGGQ